MTPWLILTAALPTSPSGLRVRIWRALKATACATLRDGVYLLPANAPTADALWAIEADIKSAGASAHMLSLAARDANQEADLQALFDRRGAYEAFNLSLKQARQQLRSANDISLRQVLRTLGRSFDAIQATDFFPNSASDKTRSHWTALQADIHARLSPEEPVAGLGRMESLKVADFQGQTWATRQRPWVDRLATAWLVIRFIDAQPRFLWLKKTSRCPKTAHGFDFDGARFSHVGKQVTFEVVTHTFGLDSDPALSRLGALVHFIDVGGAEVDEAAGVETVVRGLQALHTDDDALLAAALPLFDSLYAALKASP